MAVSLDRQLNESQTRHEREHLRQTDMRQYVQRTDASATSSRQARSPPSPSDSPLDEDESYSVDLSTLASQSNINSNDLEEEDMNSEVDNVENTDDGNNHEAVFENVAAGEAMAVMIQA